MFSPKKNIEDFIEAKNQEIESLKSKILSQRITYEEIDKAKSHLQKLKNDQMELSKENFQHLKDVLRGSHQAVTDLIQKKNILSAEIQIKKKESGEMQELMEELQIKGEKVEQVMKDSTECKYKLETRKQRKNQEIRNAEEEVSILRNQISMQKDIEADLDQAQSELKDKKSKLEKNLEEAVNENQKLKEAIWKEKEQIQKLEHELEKDEMKEENMMLKIENEEKLAQNYQQKIDIAQNFLQKYAQEKLLFLDQSEIQNNIDHLMRMCEENNEVKGKELKTCQSQIEDLEEKIKEATLKKQRTETEQQQKTSTLKDLKEKSIQLKNILNSIFQEDSNVMKLISDKKVYPTQEKQNKEENKGQVEGKKDVVGLMKTSDNFLSIVN